MTTIVLDASAVQALFPKGSEAHVELQRTVLRKLAEQFVKEPLAVTLIKAQIEASGAEIARKVLKEAGITKNAYRYEFSPELTERVQQEVRFQLNEEIASAVRKERPEVYATVEARIEQKIDAIVEDRVRAALRKHVESVMASLPRAG